MPSSKRARSQRRCFFDGCANAENLEQLTTKERVAVASALGYHATIISKFYTIEELTKKHRYVSWRVHFGMDPSTHAQRPRQRRCDIPDVTSLVASTQGPDSDRNTPPRQYSRITILLSGNLEHVHATLRSLKPTLDTYDVIAAVPTTEKAFQYACTTMDVDVISLSREAMQSRLKFQLKHALMDKALARGVVYEIPYSAMLTENASKRQHFVSNATALVQGAGCGRGIVLSSQGATAFQLRGPHDVANMATFFGMGEEEALDALSSRVEGVVGRRRKAKSYKGGGMVVSTSI